MAVSGLQQRNKPLELSYMPHGPLGSEISVPRRSTSYAGFLTWWDLQDLEQGSRAPATPCRAAKGNNQVPEVGHATTLVVMNIGRHLARAKFLRKLDALGFAGSYDFVHIPPASFGSSANAGNAFVNFVDASAAGAFASCSGLPRPWRVAVATGRQGFEENEQASTTKKVARVRNEKYRPLLIPR